MWFQSPEYLKWSRQQMLTDENINTIVTKLGLDGTMSILEVGCGSGELTRLLAERLNCVITAIDNDPGLIQYAENVCSPNVNFVCCDALALPFSDSSFDVVISHTFLTSIFDAEKAVSEMQRVCKKDGVIASITSETLTYIPHHSSPSGFSWYKRYCQLKAVVDEKFLREAKKNSAGVMPELIPCFFEECGLKDVAVYQLGKFHSLSNAILTSDEREKFLQLEYKAEITRANLLPEPERSEYINILGKRRDSLGCTHDSSWSWHGGTNLFVVGRNTKTETIPTEPYCQLQEIESINAAIDYKLDGFRANCKSISTAGIATTFGYFSAPGWTPVEAKINAHKKCLASQLLSSKYREIKQSDMADNFASNNALVTAVFDVAGIYSDSEKASFINGMVHDGEAISCIEYRRMSDNSIHLLPADMRKWCFSSKGVSCENSEESAIEDALFQIISQHVMSQVLYEDVSLQEIAVDCIKEEKIRSILLDISSRNNDIKIAVTYFSDMIPVVIILVSNEQSSMIKAAAHYKFECALENCIVKLFENKQIGSLLKGKTRYINLPYRDEDVFNLISSGDNVVPNSLFQCFNCNEPQRKCVHNESTLSLLLRLFYEKSLDIYLLDNSANGWASVEIIVPSLRTIWPFAKRRLVEGQLHEQVKKILTIDGSAETEQLDYAIQYVARKIGWKGEDTYSFFMDTSLSALLFDVPIDAKMLVGLYHIKCGNVPASLPYFPSSNKRFRCLKNIAEGMNQLVLTELYGKTEVDEVLALLENPCNAIRGTFRNEQE